MRERLNELALFAGAGGGILGGHLLGWRCVCAVELDAYARSILLARQDDGCLPPFPIWDDVQTFDGRPWRGAVDVVSGGFPCQDISVAGRGEGITGKKSGLWSHFARIIREVEPRFVLVENSPALTVRGLGTVLADLAQMGFNAEWGVFAASDCGAPHKRERLWIVAAHPHRVGCREDGRGLDGGRPFCDLNGVDSEAQEGRQDKQLRAVCDSASGVRWWSAEPDVVRVVHGVASRVDRVRCLGNGQVPAVVRLAWRTLTGGAP